MVSDFYYCTGDARGCGAAPARWMYVCAAKLRLEQKQAEVCIQEDPQGGRERADGMVVPSPSCWPRLVAVMSPLLV